MNIGDTGEVLGERRIEMWFDPRRERAYIETRTPDGGLLEAKGVDGEVYWEYLDAGYFEGGGVYRGDGGYLDIAERTAPGVAWNRWISTGGAKFVGFYPGVREGLLKGVFETRERVVNGRKVLEVTMRSTGERGEVEAVLPFYLDPLSGLPVDSDPLSGLPFDIESEWLPVEAVDPALFAPPEGLPPLRMTDRDKELTINEARQFERFDIYYLGPAVLEWPLLALWETEISYGADWSGPEVWPSTHHVGAAYGLRGDAGQPDITKVSIQSAPDELIKAPWEDPMPRPGSPGRTVAVAGVEGVLFETPGKTMLWFQLGGTVISISGENPQQVLAAAESLEKLN
jgi:hypothetical protein